MADVFISYSKLDRAIVEALAQFLEAEGYRVWWDTSLISGESFRSTIEQQLNAAKAVIVLWSANSVTSEWVTSEAEHALRVGNLVPVRLADLNPTTIPKPFNQRQTDIVDNRPAVLAALRKLGVEPRYASGIEGSLHDRFWKEIEHSQLVEDFEIYLNDFPDGPHVAFARLKIARLKRLSAAAPEQKQRKSEGTGAVRALLTFIAFAVLSGALGWQVFQIKKLREEFAAQPREADDADWTKADAAGLLIGWKDYLSTRPLGLHSAEARMRISARLDNRRTITVLEGHDDAILKLTQGDGQELTSIGEKGDIKVWSIKKMELARTPRELVLPPDASSFSKDISLSTGTYQKSEVVFGASFRVDCCYQLYVRSGNSSKSSAETAIYSMSSGTFAIRLFALDRRYTIGELLDRTFLLDHVTGLTANHVGLRGWLPLGTTAAAAHKIRPRLIVAQGVDVQVRSLPGFELLARLEGNKARVRAVAFSDDGLMAFSGSDDGIVRVWDISDLP